eukprot:568654-Prymnesium_polylepis.1
MLPLEDNGQCFVTALFPPHILPESLRRLKKETRWLSNKRGEVFRSAAYLLTCCVGCLWAAGQGPAMLHGSLTLSWLERWLDAIDAGSARIASR